MQPSTNTTLISAELFDRDGAVERLLDRFLSSDVAIGQEAPMQLAAHADERDADDVDNASTSRRGH